MAPCALQRVHAPQAVAEIRARSRAASAWRQNGSTTGAATRGWARTPADVTTRSAIRELRGSRRAARRGRDHPETPWPVGWEKAKVIMCWGGVGWGGVKNGGRPEISMA
eukprot:scaffold18437_cov128-Isochrysis_galbana.AAC.1